MTDNITGCWRKSSYSGSSGDCIEVAPTPDGAAVRDSKDSASPVLRFTAGEWAAFIGAIKTGRT
jgi:hypothetical protein